MWAYGGTRLLEDRRIGQPIRGHATGAQSRPDYVQYLRFLYRHYQYRKGLRERRQLQDTSLHGRQVYPMVHQSLTQNGFAVIPNAFSAEIVDQLRVELDLAIRCGQLCPIERNDRGQSQSLPPTLTTEEVAAGEATIAGLANIAYVKDPVITCPASMSIAFSDIVYDIASSYFGCVPMITAVHLLKSFINELPEMGFNLFHCDLQSARFIKFFVYLDDVDEDGGPFTIVPKSMSRKPFGWRLKNQWTTEEIQAYYGKDAIHPVVAKAGDLIIADTTRIHCGRKPVARQRRAIMINTGVHEIKSFANNALRILPNQLASLSPGQRDMATLFASVTNEKSDIGLNLRTVESQA